MACQVPWNEYEIMKEISVMQTQLPNLPHRLISSSLPSVQSSSPSHTHKWGIHFGTWLLHLKSLKLQVTFPEILTDLRIRYEMVPGRKMLTCFLLRCTYLNYFSINVITERSMPCPIVPAPALIRSKLSVTYECFHDFKVGLPGGHSKGSAII